MKSASSLRSILALAGCSLFAISSASSATLYWDSDTGTSGIQEGGGTFSWALGDLKFWDGSANVATTNNTTTDIAQFGNGGILGSVATVNVSTQSINGLIFGATTTNGYTLTASSASQLLTLGGSGITVNTGAQATTVGSANLGLTLGTAQSWTNNSSSLLTIAGAVTNGGNLLTIGGTGNTTVSSAIGGTGGLTKSGAGTLTLTVANTYTGGTTVSDGRLVFQNNITTGDNYAINTGATLEFNLTAGTRQINGGSFTGGGTLVKSGGSQLWLGANGSQQTVSMSSGSLIDVQGGLLRNEYGNNGWGLNLADANVASGAYLDLWDGNITVDALTGAGRVNKAWSGVNTLTLGVDNGSGTFSGTISSDVTPAGGGYTGAAGGTLNLVKQGTGTQTLSGANTYTGTTTVSGGTIAITNVLALQNSAYNTTGSNGTTIGLNVTSGLNSGTLTLGGLAGNVTLTSAFTAGFTGTVTNLTLNPQSGAANTYSGNTANGSMSLTKTGAGTQTLSGGNIAFSGTTAVNQGTLRLTSASSTSYTGDITVNATGTLALNGTNWGLRPVVNLNGGTLLTDENGGFVITSRVVNVTLDSVLQTSGTGTTGFNSQLFLDGGLNIASGRTLTYNPSTVNNGIVLRANASSSGSLVISGVGTGSLTGRANLQFNTAGASNFANTDLTLTNATMNIGVGTNGGDANSAGATINLKRKMEISHSRCKCCNYGVWRPQSHRLLLT